MRMHELAPGPMLNIYKLEQSIIKDPGKMRRCGWSEDGARESRS